MLLNIATKTRVNRQSYTGDKPYDMTDVVFILANAEEHGLRRTSKQPFTCTSCGTDLTAEKLDEGDRKKPTWPKCKSWRENGKKNCPECGEFFTPPRNQWGRWLGYEIRPKDDYSDKPTEARKRKAKDCYSDSCIICNDSIEAFYHIVPHRFYGSADPPNLVGMCKTCHQRGKTNFVDVEYPENKWEHFNLNWREMVEQGREKFKHANTHSYQSEWLEYFEKLLEKHSE